MDDADLVAADALSFPLPPKYFLEYTDEAVAKGTAPSPPLSRDQYDCFGVSCDEATSYIKPLSEYGVEVLFDPKADRIAELRRLNHATLAQFVSLVKDMSEVGASDPSAKLQRIELLFTNMHHLLNEFRPHQGRETLRAIMELQLKERDDMVAVLEATFAEAKSQLAALSSSASTTSNVAQQGQ
eukprot:m.196265 g.196265  ORF g.196265 m.196265 type:complete len:184 (-) comp19728_c0_seq1:162-713(-)